MKIFLAGVMSGGAQKIVREQYESFFGGRARTVASGYP